MLNVFIVRMFCFVERIIVLYKWFIDVKNYKMFVNYRVFVIIFLPLNYDTSFFLFSAGNAMPVTASSDGTIGIWEGKSGDLRLKLDNVNGVVRMICHPTQPVIYTCSMDGAVRVFDARNGSCVRTLTGHTDIALDVAISKVGDIVLTASDDKTSKIFRI